MADVHSTKVCTKCQIEKAIEDFGLERRTYDGRSARCRICVYQRNKDYAEKNRDRLKKYRQDIYYADVEASRKKACDNMKKFRERNPEAHKAIAKRSREKRSAIGEDQACKRRIHLRNTYGITDADYERMMESQGRVCAICRKPETRKDGRTGKFCHLAVDHSHKTGKLRQLLCAKCNYLTGVIESNRERANETMAYLDRHKDKNP
jgi:putative ubiquitin-RnfH superfamily antitoxin RatB of RatAB toxin-antitoxin module